MPNLSDYNPAVKYGANLDVNVDLADIRDSNNNELLELDTVASAVNYIRIANSVTGAAPILTAVGDDGAVGMQLSTTGSSLIRISNVTTADYDRGSATINAQRGRITAWTIAGVGTGVSTSVILYNNRIVGTSIVLASFDTLETTTGRPFLSGIEVLNGSALIRATGMFASSVGTAAVNFIVLS